MMADFLPESSNEIDSVGVGGIGVGGGNSSYGRRSKIEYAGRCSYGKKPKEFVDDRRNNVVVAKMEYDIHGFANLQHEKWGYFYTGSIKAHGHLWKLQIFPRGSIDSQKDAEYLSIYLCYAGDNNESDPVLARGYIKTKTHRVQLEKQEFSKEYSKWGSPKDIAKRDDIIKNDCNKAGTLTITVEIQVATEQGSVWYPQLYSNCDENTVGVLLYKSRTETSDVTFLVGPSQKKFQLHKNVLAVRAKDLHQLVLTEEESMSESNFDGSIVAEIVLDDVDELSFALMVKFFYMGTVPTSDAFRGGNGGDQNVKDDNTTLNAYENIKSLLVASDRYRVTELKLYTESLLVDKFLVPSRAAEFLLFADSYSCALLQEKSMNAYMEDSNAFMDTNGSGSNGWNDLKQSTKLLTELLVYTNNGRKRYSSIDDDGLYGPLEDVDDFDVTSLRERLQKVHLDVDGSKEMLLPRWKDHLLLHQQQERQKQDLAANNHDNIDNDTENTES